MQIKKWISWGLVLAWMAVIFLFSAQPGDQSGELSGSLLQTILQFWQTLFPNSQPNLDILHWVIRKGAHFAVYFVLGFLNINALKASGIHGKKAWLIAILIAIVYAISDEWHQSFVPGRGPAVKDVVIDTVGASFGTGLYQLLFRQR